MLTSLICLLIILVFFFYRYHKFVSRGNTKGHYCKRYVKTMFGTFNSTRAIGSASYEAEETVTLLTLGLKNVIPHLANTKFNYSKYNF